MTSDSQTWQILLLHCWTQQDEWSPKMRDARNEIVQAQLGGICEYANVSVWPDDFARSSHNVDDNNVSTHEVWHSFWKVLRSDQYQIIVFLSEGTFDKTYYFFDDRDPSNIKWYRAGKTIIAEKLVNRFKQRNGPVLIFAGNGTRAIGSDIDRAFRALPTSQHLSVICWDKSTERCSLDVFRDVCTFSAAFIEDVLSSIQRQAHECLDLRVTVHSFISLTRSNQGAEALPVEGTQFFPTSDVKFIAHIYFRLGLCAFELGRRLERILNHGLPRQFALDSPAKREYALTSTIFLFAELFGWLFVLRQQPAQLYHQKYIQDLEYALSSDYVEAQDVPFNKWKLGDITPGPFKVSRHDLRAMGETMVTREGPEYQVISWVEFRRQWEDAEFRLVFDQLLRDYELLERACWPDSTRPLYIEARTQTGQLLRVLTTNVRPRLAWIQNQLHFIVVHYTKELGGADSTARLRFNHLPALEEIQCQKPTMPLFARLFAKSHLTSILFDGPYYSVLRLSCASLGIVLGALLTRVS